MEKVCVKGKPPGNFMSARYTGDVWESEQICHKLQHNLLRHQRFEPGSPLNINRTSCGLVPGAARMVGKFPMMGAYFIFWGRASMLFHGCGQGEPGQ